MTLVRLSTANPAESTTRTRRLSSRFFSCCAAALAASLLITSMSNPASAQKVRFEKDILPILEDRCFQCHRAAYKDPRGRLRRPKADLRFDGKHWILRGSADGPVIEPGEPDKSSLYTLTTLPADDADIMPAKGDPLTKDQTETLRLWIEQGAEFGDWVGEPGPADEEISAGGKPAGTDPDSDPRTRVRMWAELGRDVRPASEESLTKARASKGRVEPVMPDSPLLRVGFVSTESSVTDREIAHLDGIAPQITRLSVARTKITDNALESITKMKHLTQLDLSRTAVTDAALSRLAGLGHLRSLNLFGTRITDAGLVSLAKIGRLEAVYVGETAVTEAGVEALRRLMPKTEVLSAPTLPEAERADENEARNRASGGNGK